MQRGFKSLLLRQIRTETLIQGFSPFLYVPAKSKCKTTFAPGNLQVFSLPQSQKFPEQFLPQKPHRENAPTVFGGCITKRLPGFRFAVGGYRFVNSPFVLFWVQTVENHGILTANYSRQNLRISSIKCP